MNEISAIPSTPGVTLDEPDRRIARRAISMWRISAAIWALVYLFVPIVIYSASLLQSIPTTVIWTAYGLLIVLGIFQVTWWPNLRWRFWRYRIGEQEIDLQRGLIFHHRTLIPMRRVQHVDMRRGPLLRRFRLATISITTAATTHDIPALDLDTADQVRRSISKFARLADDDV